MAEAHWEKWMDQSIPALNGMTPRESSKNKRGKDLLKSLLLFYEQQDLKAPSKYLRFPDGKIRLYSKGAIEVILQMCSTELDAGVRHPLTP